MGCLAQKTDVHPLGCYCSYFVFAYLLSKINCHLFIIILKRTTTTYTADGSPTDHCESVGSANATTNTKSTYHQLSDWYYNCIILEVPTMLTTKSTIYYEWFTEINAAQ